jgi:signal transduction histidine kinase
MVATVSHEIKSPLGIVRSTAEILEKRIQKVAPGNEHLARIIVDETMRLNRIVVEFLDFARPQKMQMEWGNINEIAEKVLAFLAPMIREQHVELIADLAADLPATEIDRDQLYRSMLNILLNAIQAMEGGGVLRVWHPKARVRTQIEIVIKDNGVGIAEESISRSSNRFLSEQRQAWACDLEEYHRVMAEASASRADSGGRPSSFVPVA